MSRSIFTADNVEDYVRNIYAGSDIDKDEDGFVYSANIVDAKKRQE